MIRIYSIYNRMLCGILLLIVICGMGMSCTDDYFSENTRGSVRMATLDVRLPKADPGSDSEVTSARFIAFEAGGAGISGVLQVNSDITPTGARIQIPVGKSNVYVVANAPDSLKLDEISSESQLKEKIAAWEAVKKLPHIMVGSYLNVSISASGVQDNAGNTITVGNNLKRLVARLTVNLQYQSLGGDELVIDEITVGNRASYSPLLPAAFSGNTYVSSDADKATSLTATGTTDGLTTYQPIEFYLSEYLVNEAHKSNSTCLSIHAHTAGKEDEPLTFPVYIGDWFGKGITYEDFKNADTPAALVGVEGLSVTRNKHYTLTCKLKGAERTEIGLTTNVVEWTVVDINGNINTPFLNVDRTDVMVNAISGGTAVYYTSSVPRDSIEIDIVDNPDNRFAAVINANDPGKIYFIHQVEGVKRITTSTGAPITGKAIVTAKDGNAKIKKEITLGVFNPISKFFLRSTGVNYDYGSVTPITNINSTAKMDWRTAMGYTNPYTGATSTLKGVNPNQTLMKGALPNAYTGCADYWEVSKDDRQKGRGCWRLPYSGEIHRLISLINSLEDLPSMGYDQIKFSTTERLWSSTETSAGVAYYGWPAPPYFEAMTKGIAYSVRCVRDIDNSDTSGGASYLNVSHNTYEIAPMTYRQVPGIVPIYYESDGEVSISLLDENGQDISNMGAGMPFIGFSAASEDALFGTSEPQIAFPNKDYAGMKKAYFCLHSTVKAASEYMTSLGDMQGPMMSEMRKHKYSLVFRSGNLSKTVPISVVSPLATQNLSQHLSLIDAMGISSVYSGYDYIQDKIFNKSQVVTDVAINMPVPDRFDSGCANYYEGSPTDYTTGKGNWFLAPSTLTIGGAYSANSTRWGLSAIGTFQSLNKMYGDGLNFKADDAYTNVDFWSTRSATSYNISKHGVVHFFSGSVSYQLKTSKYRVRCERRLNADILSLSNQSITLSKGETAEVIYYTSTGKIATSILPVSGTDSAFTTTTTTTTSRIIITCSADAASGSESNLLVHTEGGKSTRSRTYKIIKLKVK